MPGTRDGVEKAAETKKARTKYLVTRAVVEALIEDPRAELSQKELAKAAEVSESTLSRRGLNAPRIAEQVLRATARQAHLVPNMWPRWDVAVLKVSRAESHPGDGQPFWDLDPRYATGSSPAASRPGMLKARISPEGFEDRAWSWAPSDLALVLANEETDRVDTLGGQRLRRFEEQGDEGQVEGNDDVELLQMSHHEAQAMRLRLYAVYRAVVCANPAALAQDRPSQSRAVRAWSDLAFHFQDVAEHFRYGVADEHRDLDLEDLGLPPGDILRVCHWRVEEARGYLEATGALDAKDLWGPTSDVAYQWGALRGRLVNPDIKIVRAAATEARAEFSSYANVPRSLVARYSEEVAATFFPRFREERRQDRDWLALVALLDVLEAMLGASWTAAAKGENQTAQELADLARELAMVESGPILMLDDALRETPQGRIVIAWAEQDLDQALSSAADLFEDATGPAKPMSLLAAAALSDDFALGLLADVLDTPEEHENDDDLVRLGLVEAAWWTLHRADPGSAEPQSRLRPHGVQVRLEEIAASSSQSSFEATIARTQQVAIRNLISLRFAFTATQRSASPELLQAADALARACRPLGSA